MRHQTREQWDEWYEANKKHRQEYHKDWYKNNKEKRLAQIKARKQGLKEWFNELKSELTCSCGESHIATITFHHDDPTEKEHDVAFMVVQGWSKNKILEEMEKCTVMCENCHRKLHWEERQRSLV